MINWRENITNQDAQNTRRFYHAQLLQKLKQNEVYEERVDPNMHKSI